MAATLMRHPPTEGDWLYELKWDGYRVLVLKNGPEVELYSRNHKPLTTDFPEIAEALTRLPVETAILDGEVCAVGEDGRPSFQLLQSRDLGQARPTLLFYGFDLLELEGEDWRRRPLTERKERLCQLLQGLPGPLFYSASLAGEVEDLLAAVRQQGLEGLIGKRARSVYVPGVRSVDWIKLKVSQEQEFVIGGYSPPKGSRQHFGALLVGYYQEGRLEFAGKVGTGFDGAWLRRLSEMLAERAVEECPLAHLRRRTGGRWGQGLTPAEIRQCGWVRPELVCQVRFSEWTEEGLLRQPVFLGLRKDKDASEVRREG